MCIRDRKRTVNALKREVHSGLQQPSRWLVDSDLEILMSHRAVQKLTMQQKSRGKGWSLSTSLKVSGAGMILQLPGLLPGHVRLHEPRVRIPRAAGHHAWRNCSHHGAQDSMVTRNVVRR